MGAEGFESYYLQRPKRFDKYKFDLCMHIQKIYAGPTRLAPSASAEARENEERAKERRRRSTLGLSPAPPLVVPKQRERLPTYVQAIRGLPPRAPPQTSTEEES